VCCDVALLLADIVGPSGQVIGIDRNAKILETAKARVQASGLTNVEFRTADIWTTHDIPQVDAIVGRWILMHLADPAGLLHRLSESLRPGGIIAFQESDLTYPQRTFPELPLASQIYKTIAPRAIPGGPDMAMGARLFEVFTAAGLPSPQLRAEMTLGGGPDWLGYEYLAETVRSLMPVLERFTGIDPAGIEIDTLAARLRDEALAHHAVQMLPLVVGAWARKAA
jgi:SAM-dependent methyltransferase